ncbi:uncharacterized protein LOC127854981 [Dreissena polymorpha]|uniref:WW domain binding protein VOPP1 n=1 Tax=Dreissena polymorpha TaxID=45954 RepID=A0A9D4HF44_DREPO|nr:uncharacterized protein LOC127854981 [Dreissena polymorpha]KAH3716855.1 hypothetical protein DPMN_059586 [Dreissena polymorpha]
MAKLIERSVLIGILFGFLDYVAAYYCDNDKCLEDQFCCGENICCVSYKVWELWYFWCGILFCLLLLSLCGCFWQQRQRAYWMFHTANPNPYRPLDVEGEETKYSQSHKDGYHGNKERSPQFYSPAQGTDSWYHHNIGSQPTSVYTDSEQLYDTNTSRKPEY